MSNTSRKISLTGDPEDVARITKAVREALQTDPPPSPGFASIVKRVQTTIGRYWFLSGALLFALAWLFFGADPFYPIKTWANASKQLNASLKKHKYQSEQSGHYCSLGRSLMRIDKFGDAEQAFQRAKGCDAHSLEAEYGLTLSRLLNFSSRKELDPQVIAERIATARHSCPEGISPTGVVAYAEARLKRATGACLDTVTALLHYTLAADPGYAAAYNLLGLLLLEHDSLSASLAALTSACSLAAHESEYHYNLSTAYERAGTIDSAYAALVRCRQLNS